LLELGRSLGLKMYGTASAEKCETVRELGGIPIDYTRENFVRVLREKEPGGVDVVFDGLGHTVARSYRVLSRGGTVVAYGHAPVVAGGRRHWGKLLGTVAQFAWVFGRAVLSSRKARLYSIQELKKKRPDWYLEDLNRLFHLLGEGTIKPRIFDRMPLERAQDALELVSQSAVIGKIILFADQARQQGDCHEPRPSPGFERKTPRHPEFPPWSSRPSATEFSRAPPIDGDVPPETVNDAS